MMLRPYVVMATFALMIAAGVLFSTDVPVVEHIRLTADLDGDDKHETVTLSTSGTGNFQRYWVRVGAATFDGEFFAGFDGLPKMKLIRIDSSTKQKQLLIETPGASYCGYVILAFTQDRFFRLLEHSSKNCEEPRVLGDGLETITWVSFWDLRERYTLTARGTKLNRANQTIYPVTLTRDGAFVTEVVGVARKPLVLKPADCKDATIPKGDRVVVRSYDVSQDQYLLKGSGDRCGWMSDSDLHPDAVDGLPWAG